MRKSRIAFFLAATAGLACSFAIGANCYYNPNGSGNWGDSTRWYGGAVPQSGDLAYVTNGVMRVTDADLEIVSRVNGMYPRNASDVLEFDIDGDFHFAPRITGDGKIVKNGSGALYLDAKFSRLYLTTGGIEVNDGELHLVEVETTDKNEFTYGPLAVNAPGKLFLRPGGTSYTPGISGDGVITNISTEARQLIMITNFAAAAGTVYAFSGVVSPNVDLTFNGVERQDMLSDNPYELTIRAQSGTIGVPKFGVTGSPGSLGSKYNIAVAGNTEVLPRFLYLGNGETTAKCFQMNSTPRGIVFDGGAKGGLVLVGTNRFTYSLSTMTQMILDGSNTEACVWRAQVWENRSDAELATYVIKRGTGTWRMEYESKTELRGGVAVEEGVLEADLLREAPLGSSIGQGKVLQSAYYGAKDPSKDVPYAILLGNGTIPGDSVDSTIGTLSYVGGNATVSVSTRPIAITGAGRLRNASSNASNTFSWTGITARDAGPCVLALDCAAGSVNTISSVTNGPGRMTVVKEGVGTWTIAGDFDVSAYDVRGGVLNLSVATSDPGAVKPTVADYVAVAANSTLRSDAVLPANELRYDVPRGGGTLDGFSFPADGVVSVTGVGGSARDEVSLPCVFTNCTGVENMESWTLRVNGVETSSRTLQVVPSGLLLVPKGLTIIFK